MSSFCKIPETVKKYYVRRTSEQKLLKTAFLDCREYMNNSYDNDKAMLVRGPSP